MAGAKRATSSLPVEYRVAGLLRPLLASLASAHPRLREELHSRLYPVWNHSTQGKGPRIWVHAASVGEVSVLEEYATRLKEIYPDLFLFVTCNTLAGLSRARRLETSPDATALFPFDLPPALRRILDGLQPELIVLVERELWPGLISLAEARSIPVQVANARLSKTSVSGVRLLARRYPAVARHPRWFVREENDLAHLHEAGIPLEHMAIHGEMRLDALDDSPPGAGNSRTDADDDTPLFVAGSTHAGEEKILFEAFKIAKRNEPRLKMLVAPRHLHRCGDVLEMAQRMHLRAETVSRAELSEPPEVLVLDRMGELVSWYERASATFVGGSLFEGVGGHNVLEPLAKGCPVLFGKYCTNWAAWCAMIDQYDAGSFVTQADDIARKIMLVLENRKDVDRAVRLCWITVRGRKGAAERNVRAAKQALEGEDPCVWDESLV